MRRTARLAFLAVLVALLPVALEATQHPNTARGFDIGKPYQMNGIDNINLFNGNLTVTIPIGQRYHVNGNLSYGLTLVYSGNVWDTVDLERLTCGSTIKWVPKTYPNRLSNAGLGWLVSLGRLFPPNQWPLTENLAWNYETPDGGLHEFSTNAYGNQPANMSYTRDGSFLRMVVTGNVRTVEFPDGTSQVFKELQTPTNGVWSPAAGTGVWRLVETKDRFGNSVTVQYSAADATGSEPQYAEIWTINDGLRTQSVYFKAIGNTGSPSPYQMVLDHVVLTTFNGSTSTWTPSYVYRTMTPGAKNGQCGSDFTQPWVNVPLLSSFTLPPVNGVSQVYSMLDPSGAINYLIDPDLYFAHSTNGHLKGLRLPTKGWLEWDYQSHLFFSTEEGISRSLAVKKRRMITADRSHTDEWVYDRANSTGQSCVDPIDQTRKYNGPEQLVVAVRAPVSDAAPLQVTSVHYFSTYNEGSVVSSCATTTTFDGYEDSLPFSRGVPSRTINGVPHYLSEEIYTGTPPTLTTGPGGYQVTGGTRVRSEWVAYEIDSDSLGYGEAPFNSRQKTHVTYFDDDANCSGTCYSGAVNSGYDGFGHYRQSSTFGNFQRGGATDTKGNFKTTFTAFSAADPFGTWLLNLFTERCSAQETQQRSDAVTQCAALAGAGTTSSSIVTRACFDPNTGFLTRSRALSGASPGQNDLLAAYTGDGHGNVSREDFYGGDTATVEGSGACTAALPATPQYTVNHTYTAGSLATSQYAGVTSKLADNTIDANTGLARIARDAAGVGTTFDYDVLGRLDQVSRPGESVIDYAFTEAAGTTPARVTVTQVSAAGTANTGATTQEKTLQSVTIFDGFGRVSEEQRLMPSGTAKRITEYTPSGWTYRVSEWEATPSHFTVFSNFDAFGRAGTITAPDASQSNIAYAGARRVDRTVCVAADTAPCQKTTQETYDRFGRLIQVKEPDGISDADYEYDGADRLTKVSMTAQGITQVRTFTYDGRGLLASEEHPESGKTTYGRYDARGHVGSKFTGVTDSPSDLFYEYDAAERLVTVKHPATRGENPANSAVVKSFAFADQNSGSNYRAGKLETATRKNYSPLGLVTVMETYKYEDPAGRLSSKITTISGPSGLGQTHTQSYTYNDLGLRAATTYPSCGQCAAPSFTVTPTYKNGLLKSVENFTTSIDYDLNGMVTQISHPGGIDDVITPDSSKMPRPGRIQFNSYDACTAPVITQHPLTQQIAAGNSTMLTVAVSASATTPLVYQWFKDDAADPMPNESSSSCCGSGITTSGKYRVSVVNSCGKADSNVAFVSVCGSPAITMHPQSTQVASGNGASLTVAGTGCSLTYEWYRQSSPTAVYVGSGSTFNTGALSSTTSYYVRAVDSVGSVATSNVATVTVCGVPSITTQPASSTYAGMPVTLTVTPSGCGTFTYQWYRGATGNTANLVGTSSTYTVASLTATTQYWVRVTDGVGVTVNSNTATITVACFPEITLQPQPDTTYSGSPITLSIQVTGGCPPYHYQWYRGPSANVTQGVGEDSPSYSPPPPTGTTYYWVRVTDSSGGTTDSNVAAIHCSPATVSVQPMSAVYPGSPVTLTATANGCGPFNYVWYAGVSGDTSTAPLLSNSATFTTPQLSATARYWVKVLYDDWSVSVNSGTIVITVPLATPASMNAQLSGSNQITVTWGASPGAHHYELQRLAFGNWTTINTTATSYVDSGLAPNAAYVYRVRAVDSLGGSASGYASDLATNISFASIQANVTVVSFAHFDQILTAVNAIRAAHGDSDLTWHQILVQAGYDNAPDPAQNAVVRAVHLAALRDGMTKARAAVQVPAPAQGYADSLTTPTLIRAVHITELQQRAQ